MRKGFKFSGIYIVVIFVFLYLPILSVVIYSFNASKTSAVWGGFTLDWYIKMIHNRRLMESLWVSVEVGIGSALVSAVLGVVGALALDKFNAKVHALFTGVMVIPLIIPEIILGVALLLFFSNIPELNYGIGTLIISHTTFCVPYIFMLTNIRLKAIDVSIIESAKDLGAKDFYIFKTIIFPLILPGMASGMLLAIAMSLDDVVISFFLSGPTSMTLPIKIYSLLKLGVTPDINALSTIILLITFILIGIIQYFRWRKDLRKETAVKIIDRKL